MTAEGKEPRLVLDSAVCNANIACRVPEKVSLPSNLDVRRAFSSDDAFGQWVALSLDFKAARKSIKVQDKEHGCLLFEAAGKLFHYVVCHFGAKFSAYWWQRAGGQMLRVVHALLATFSHRAWLYVQSYASVCQRGRWSSEKTTRIYIQDSVALLTELRDALTPKQREYHDSWQSLLHRLEHPSDVTGRKGGRGK